MPRGWKVRTVKRGDHEARIAFPPGARKKGSGRLISILHPKTELNPEPECLLILQDGVAEAGVPEAGTPEYAQLAEGVEEIVTAPVDLNGAAANPKAKSKTREQLERLQDKAVRFLRDVVGDDDKADEIEGLSVEEYADRKRIHLANPTLSLPAAWAQASPAMRRRLLKAAGTPGPYGEIASFYRLPAKAQKALAYAAAAGHAGVLQASTDRKNAPRRKKKNLDEVVEAAKLYEQLEGAPATKITDLEEPDARRDDFAKIGDLVGLVIEPRTVEAPGPADGEEIAAWRDERGLEFLNQRQWEELAEDFAVPIVTLAFTGQKVAAATEAGGHQLYFLGGNQNLDGVLSKFGTDETKDFVELGHLLAFGYFSRKAAGGHEPTDYWHILAEEGGLQPIAYYNRLQKRIFVVGGDYYIEGPWVRN